MRNKHATIKYGNLKGYRQPETYIPSRYSSLYGRFRLAREGSIFQRFLDLTLPGETILDCPHGVGRLLGTFQSHRLKVIGLDISEEMLLYAKKHTESKNLIRGLAEVLPIRDKAVDWVFCFALMKHLPPERQLKTMIEFTQVAKKGIVISFAIWNPLSFTRWWWGQRQHTDESDQSFPVPDAWVTWTAQRLGLRIAWRHTVFPILGMETVYLFLKDDAI